MKIIIAGAGAVGTHLARLLSREQHDIIVIDEDEHRVEVLLATLDVQALQGNPMSIEMLREAEVNKADLFIAVTPDEAHNITCSILANQLGAKKTIARVDNSEYVEAAHQELLKEVGVKSTLYPDLMAAEQIVLGMRRSWVRQHYDFQGGELVMLGVKVRKGAPLLEGGRPIREVVPASAPYHIVAIKRGDDTLIPGGNDTLRDRDMVYFMTTPEYIPEIRIQAGKGNYPDVKTLFIVGISDTTLQLLRILPRNIKVKLFDSDSKKIKKLMHDTDYPNVKYFRTNGLDVSLLKEEGIESAQAFAALSDSSDENVLTCLTAKRFGIHKTVALVENTDYIPVAEKLDIGTIVNKKILAAGKIYQMMLRDDKATVKSLTVAQADVAEFTVAHNARVTRRPVKDLELPDNVALGGLVRDGKGILINGNTQILPGDTVVAFCLLNMVKKLEKYFN